MKKLIILLIVILGTVSVYTQPFSSKSEWEQYFIDKIQNLEPLEGIWSASSTEKFFDNYNRLIKSNNHPQHATYSIYKVGTKYFGSEIVSGKKYSLIVFTNTVTSDIFLMTNTYYESSSSAKGNAVLTGSAFLEFSYELPLKEIRYRYRDYRGDKSEIDKLKITYQQEWIKIFPQKQDYEISKPLSGTGFAISSDGYIVTNYHVVADAKKIEIKGINGNFSTKYKARLIVKDERNDLALLKINDPSFTSLDKIPYNFRTNLADVGENIFVLGYPLTTSMGEEIKLTNGIVSSKTGYEGDISMYQISAPVQPGNSGGPLYDNNGNIIGVVSAKHTQAENVGYAIKANYLKSLLELAPDKISLPVSNTLKGKTLTEQVKIASNFIYMVLLNDNSIVETPSYNQSAGSTSSNLSKNNSLSYCQKAQEQLQNNEVESALASLQKALDADNGNIKAYWMRGGIFLYYKRNYNAAIADFTKCIQMKPDVAEGYFKRGMAYYHNDNEIEAIKDYTKCIKIALDHVDAYFMRARVKAMLGDRNGAISDYKEIINLENQAKPTIFLMGTVYNNIGYSYVELERYDEAKKYLDKAVKLEPNESYIWGSLGELHYLTGKYKECIEDMSKAIELDEKKLSQAPSDEPGVPYYYRGLSNIKLGNKVDGCKDLSKAGELGYEDAYKKLGEHCN